VAKIKDNPYIYRFWRKILKKQGNKRIKWECQKIDGEREDESPPLLFFSLVGRRL